MIKTFLSGFVIGIANIIPGVSGGTMMVLLGIYDQMLEVISNVVKPKNTNRFKDIRFITVIVLGGIVGIVGFAKILDILFLNIEIQTYYLFIGLITSSLIIFLKDEFSNNKLNISFLVLGLLLVISIELLNINNLYIGIPEISLVLLLSLLLTGMIAGSAMIIPGVSGSMLLLILGKYLLIKDYISNLFAFKINIIIPLGVFAVGMLLGIFISAKVISKLIKNYRMRTLSFIVGLIVASIVVMIPIVEYDLNLTMTSIIAFIIGFGIINLMQK